METSFSEDRLSRISTIWSMVLKANQGGVAGDADALEEMIHRYHGAVYRYFLGAVRNNDTADELFQEFALRFARGGFRNADPGKGRFRDFLRTVLINLIHDYGRAKKRQMDALSPDSPDPADSSDGVSLEDSFVMSWREELLDRAWRRLAELEAREGQPYHTILRYRSEHPDARSGEIATAMTEHLQPATPFTDVGIRKLLQRSREQFSDFLLDEVASSLRMTEQTDLSRLEEELIDLELLAYCRSSLDRRKNAVQSR